MRASDNGLNLSDLDLRGSELVRSLAESPSCDGEAAHLAFDRAGITSTRPLADLLFSDFVSHPTPVGTIVLRGEKKRVDGAFDGRH